MGRRRLASGASAPAGGHFPCGMRPPLSSSQSPLSSVSLAVTSSASLVPAMLTRTRSLRCSGSPHRAGRGGGPNAKTAPAPLHPKGTSAPTPWAWALRLSPPRGARRGPHLETSRRKCAAPGGKFGGSVCAGADLLPPAGEGWRSLAAVRDGNARPLGKPLARGSLGYILR